MVTRSNVEETKEFIRARLGNDYVYGGALSSNLKQGTDCSEVWQTVLEMVLGRWKQGRQSEGATTESYRYIPVGGVGPFGTIRVAKPEDIPANAAARIAFHHGQGGGANSHMWGELDGMLIESAGSKGLVTQPSARRVDDSYAMAWAYLPGPIGEEPQLTRADRYAVTIIKTGQRLSVTPRGIKIALATGLVESNLKVYANDKVPASMDIPHDDVGSDGYSVGIFQQQVRDTGNGWWWGDAATCMDPERSAALFYSRLVRLDYNGPNSPGSYAQAVQQSAFPYRYDERYADAEQLYNRLVSITAEEKDEWDELMADETLYTSKSWYRDDDKPTLSLKEAIRNLDAMEYGRLVEDAALRGDPWGIATVARLAAEQGPAGTDRWAVDRARYVLNLVEKNNPAALHDFLKATP